MSVKGVRAFTVLGSITRCLRNAVIQRQLVPAQSSLYFHIYFNMVSQLIIRQDTILNIIMLFHMHFFFTPRVTQLQFVLCRF